MSLFNQEVTLSEDYVYHYTSLEVAIENILFEGRLRFSPFIQTNDPRESKDWNVSITHTNGIEISTESLLEIVEKFNRKLKKDIKILCMTDEDKNSYNQINYGGRGFAHSRMWAQYASNHRGVCLVFDKRELHHTIITELDRLKQIYFGRVDYNSYYPINVDDYEAFNINQKDMISKEIDELLNDHVTRYYKTLYLRKAPDWRDENEFRWVIQSSQDYEYVSIDSSLRAVILGVETPREYDSVFSEFQEKYKIEVSRMHWYNGNPTPLPAF
ncbi:DUF2971 domain-containing protein [Ornithinibacillus bavariensis]|uniref:DUF2971 domain-containing protein n=1 Tax=Ornithinibacillus bavariensis TaxID=545502 RepID=A0A919X7C3_9BACI|nr:DUF2971 domain-containing protein [Ornithinibacillus bavariensis]GIO26384.1 hypothetical protein J43TS3_09950 [Ornithinibacillus bavariensis]